MIPLFSFNSVVSSTVNIPKRQLTKLGYSPSIQLQNSNPASYYDGINPAYVSGTEYVSRVTDPIYPDQYAELRKISKAQTYAMSNGWRAETKWQADGIGNLYPGTEYWMAFAWYWSKNHDSPAVGDSDQLLFQTHTPANGDTNPAINMVIWPNYLQSFPEQVIRWYVAYNTKASTTWISNGGANPDTEANNVIAYSSMIPESTWQRVIIRYIPGYLVGHNPIYEVWTAIGTNEYTKLFSHTGFNTYNHTSPDYTRLGIYKWGYPSYGWSNGKIAYFMSGLWWQQGTNLLDAAKETLSSYSRKIEYAPRVANSNTVEGASISPTNQLNEYIAADAMGLESGTDGSSTWGNQQNRLVRMEDGTLFALYFSTSNIIVKRSATGGIYGSSWTTVATISKGTTADQDAHLVRNPALNVVHLLYTDTTPNYRIRTWNSTGNQLDDTIVSDGGGPYGFFNEFVGSTRYSDIGIGPDGTIAFAWSVTGLAEGTTSTEMSNCMRIMTMKWNGHIWQFNPIKTQSIGPRHNYRHIYVNPKCAPGYILGISRLNILYNQYTQTYNPNYQAGWTYTNGMSQYFGPGLMLWKFRISDLGDFQQNQAFTVPFRTTDLPDANFGTEKTGQVWLYNSDIDSKGRIWFTTWDQNPNTQVTTRRIHLINADTLTITSADISNYTAGYPYALHIDKNDKVYIVCSNIGTNMEWKIVTATESGGVITVGSYSAGTNVRASAIGSNINTGYWHDPATGPASLANIRSGSVKSSNFLDYTMVITGDMTGTFPGTVRATQVAGSYDIKRVRVNIPDEILIPTITSLNADQRFSESNTNLYVQMLGGSTALTSISESGISYDNTALADDTLAGTGSSLRFGKITDPIISGRKVFLFGGKRGDPITFLHTRTELTGLLTVEWGTTYWVAFEMYIPTSRMTTGYGGNLMQIHCDGGSPTAQGAWRLHWYNNDWVRLNTWSGNPGSEAIRDHWIENNTAYPVNTWQKYVIKWRQKNDGSNGYFRAWRNGIEIGTEYTGPIGIIQSASYKDYLKHGWDEYDTSTQVSLDGAYQLTRSVHVVQDNNYTLQQIMSLLT